MNIRTTLFACIAFVLLTILNDPAHSQEALPGSIYKNSIGMEFVADPGRQIPDGLSRQRSRGARIREATA